MATVTLTPTADSWVDADNPSATHGSATLLEVDGADPYCEAYLRFVIPAGGAISSATLRLRSSPDDQTSDAPRIHRITTPGVWSESTVTYATRPAYGATAVADVDAFWSPDTWISYNVTSAMPTSGTVELALVPDTTDGVDIWSREGTYPPELVLVRADVATGLALTPTAGAASLGTQTATLTGGMAMAAGTGASTLAGTTAVLTGGMGLSADAGTVTASGSTAALTGGMVLAADTGTLAMSGTTATLTVGVTGLALAPEPAVLTASGTVATLTGGMVMTGTAGTATLAGHPAAFGERVPIVPTVSLTAHDIAVTLAAHDTAASFTAHAPTDTFAAHRS